MNNITIGAEQIRQIRKSIEEGIYGTKGEHIFNNLDFKQDIDKIQIQNMTCSAGADIANRVGANTNFVTTISPDVLMLDMTDPIQGRHNMAFISIYHVHYVALLCRYASLKISNQLSKITLTNENFESIIRNLKSYFNQIQVRQVELNSNLFDGYADGIRSVLVKSIEEVLVVANKILPENLTTDEDFGREFFTFVNRVEWIKFIDTSYNFYTQFSNDNEQIEGVSIGMTLSTMRSAFGDNIDDANSSMTYYLYKYFLWDSRISLGKAISWLGLDVVSHGHDDHDDLGKTITYLRNFRKTVADDIPDDSREIIQHQEYLFGDHLNLMPNPNSQQTLDDLHKLFHEFFAHFYKDENGNWIYRLEHHYDQYLQECLHPIVTRAYFTFDNFRTFFMFFIGIIKFLESNLKDFSWFKNPIFPNKFNELMNIVYSLPEKIECLEKNEVVNFNNNTQIEILMQYLHYQMVYRYGAKFNYETVYQKFASKVLLSLIHSCDNPDMTGIQRYMYQITNFGTLKNLIQILKLKYRVDISSYNRYLLRNLRKEYRDILLSKLNRNENFSKTVTALIMDQNELPRPASSIEVVNQLFETIEGINENTSQITFSNQTLQELLNNVIKDSITEYTVTKTDQAQLSEVTKEYIDNISSTVQKYKSTLIQIEDANKVSSDITKTLSSKLPVTNKILRIYAEMVDSVFSRTVSQGVYSVVGEEGIFEKIGKPNPMGIDDGALIELKAKLEPIFNEYGNPGADFESCFVGMLSMVLLQTLISSIARYQTFYNYNNVRFAIHTMSERLLYNLPTNQRISDAVGTIQKDEIQEFERYHKEPSSLTVPYELNKEYLMGLELRVTEAKNQFKKACVQEIKGGLYESISNITDSSAMIKEIAKYTKALSNTSLIDEEMAYMDNHVLIATVVTRNLSAQCGVEVAQKIDSLLAKVENKESNIESQFVQNKLDDEAIKTIYQTISTNLHYNRVLDSDRMYLKSRSVTDEQIDSVVKYLSKSKTTYAQFCEFIEKFKGLQNMDASEKIKSIKVIVNSFCNISENTTILESIGNAIESFFINRVGLDAQSSKNISGHLKQIFATFIGLLTLAITVLSTQLVSKINSAANQFYQQVAEQIFDESSKVTIDSMNVSAANVLVQDTLATGFRLSLDSRVPGFSTITEEQVNSVSKNFTIKIVAASNGSANGLASICTSNIYSAQLGANARFPLITFPVQIKNRDTRPSSTIHRNITGQGIGPFIKAEILWDYDFSAKTASSIGEITRIMPKSVKLFFTTDRYIEITKNANEAKIVSISQ